METINSICIIEDEIDIVDAMKVYLEGEGYSVIAFNSTEEFVSNVPSDFKGLYLGIFF